MPAVKVHNTREVDELILLDISATFEQRTPDFDSIREVSAECFVPLTVGGGVRTLEDIRNLLKAGADKVCITTAAVEDPKLIQEGASKFGSQCIVVGIDGRKNNRGVYECLTHCGTRETGVEVSTWARDVEKLGAGEIMITSVERDGTMSGYDLDLIASVAKNVSVPVIASGGAGNYQHMLEAIQTAKASAVAAASIYQFTQQTPIEAKKFLARNGVHVRSTGIGNGSLCRHE